MLLFARKGFYKKIAIILLFLAQFSLLAENISIKTENYPPYNMEVSGELQGLSVDILDAMFKQMGTNLDEADIELTSWSEAYSSALNNKNNMVFSTTMTQLRKDLFKWVGPISQAKIGLIAHKSKNIKIQNLSDLNNYVIGTVNNDIGETLLLAKGISKKNFHSIDGTNSLATLLYQLERNKIDIIAYDTRVALYSADLNGFDQEEYEVIYTLENNGIYFAFNKQTDDAVIQKWQNALDGIKSNGTYDKIIKKY